MKFMILSPLIRKVGAAGITTLMLSALAHADDGVTGLVNTTLTDTTDLLHKNPPGVPSAVPEANAALVLIPVVAAMLFFSMRRLGSAKTALKTEDQQGSR
jgi:hypothetical protein